MSIGRIEKNMISYDKLWKTMKEKGITQYTLIKKYNIQLVPTVILLDSSGKVCQKIEGAASKDEYEAYIQDCK